MNSRARPYSKVNRSADGAVGRPVHKSLIQRFTCKCVTMSASSEDDYHSAEEEGGASHAVDTTRFSRGLEGASLSEKDSPLRSEVGHATGISSGEGTELRDTAERYVDRTAASNEEKASSDHGEGGEEKSASPEEREVQKLTEEEIVVRPPTYTTHTHRPSQHVQVLGYMPISCVYCRNERSKQED